jgi:ParB-like chromosome segregation protein Spo0J
VCQATFIPFDSIIVDESLNVRADDAGTDQFKAFLASINEEGLLKPLIVVWDGDAYKLVNGFRRYRAITELRALDRQAFEKIPVFILALNSKEAIARCILGNL